MLTFTFTYFWKQLQSAFYFMLQFLQWTILRMLWVKGVFSLYLSIPGLRKGPGKFLTGSWKVLDFFQWMRGNPGYSFQQVLDAAAHVIISTNTRSICVKYEVTICAGWTCLNVYSSILLWHFVSVFTVLHHWNCAFWLHIRQSRFSHQQ